MNARRNATSPIRKRRKAGRPGNRPETAKEPLLIEPEPLQHAGRTCIRWRRRTLTCFSGCDYFRLSSHPAVVQAVHRAVRRFGLSVSASRMTTGNHSLYLELEAELADYFGAGSALLTPTGYLTPIIAAQSLSGEFSRAFIDERCHPALKDAARFLDCPVSPFPHRDPDDLRRRLRRTGAKGRTLVLTDGMFAFDGSVAPLREYLELLPASGCLLVDDAHAAGVLGASGKGSIEVERADRARIVQCVTLSKAFGAYGGAILCTRELRQQLLGRSRPHIGSTALPLPIAAAALEAIRILRNDRAMRARLHRNAERVKQPLRAAGLAFPESPSPIVPIQFPTTQQIDSLKRALLKVGIYPPFIRYPGSPANGYFRFVISSEHSFRQLDTLADVLIRHGSRKL